MKPSILITAGVMSYFVTTYWNWNILELFGAAVIYGVVCGLLDAVWDDLWSRRKVRAK